MEALTSQTHMRAFDPKSVPKPPGCPQFDWSKCTDHLVFEIGCGNGMHPIAFAKQNPQSTVIAIEQTQNKFQSFEKKLKAQPMPHLHAIRADALWWCAHNLQMSHFLDEIYLLYPNPYPKQSQANKRFHNMPFMGFLLKHLKVGGRVHVASNLRAYIKEAKTRFVSTWELTLDQEIALDHSFTPRTAFEKKYLERGETCKNLCFLKK
jgi:tRNA (guanine-N7-)-methyltransferase